MRFIKKFIITLLVILLLGAGVAGGRLIWQGYQIYQEVIDGEPLSEKVEEIRSKPKYTPLSQLPDTYKNAVVAVEDKRFYKHGGIDLISTGRAVFINLKEKKLAEGGKLHYAAAGKKHVFFPGKDVPEEGGRAVCRF